MTFLKWIWGSLIVIFLLRVVIFPRRHFWSCDEISLKNDLKKDDRQTLLYVLI
nr:MAG TPA: hypothetical protein [Caudoviricetes sp.]